MLYKNNKNKIYWSKTRVHSQSTAVLHNIGGCHKRNATEDVGVLTRE